MSLSAPRGSDALLSRKVSIASRAVLNGGITSCLVRRSQPHYSMDGSPAPVGQPLRRLQVNYVWQGYLVHLSCDYAHVRRCPAMSGDVRRCPAMSGQARTSALCYPLAYLDHLFYHAAREKWRLRN